MSAIKACSESCTCLVVYLLSGAYTAGTYYTYINCTWRCTVSWGIVPCSAVEVHSHYGILCCLHLPKSKLRQKLAKNDVTSRKLWDLETQNVTLLLLKECICGFLISMWNAKIMWSVYHWKFYLMMKSCTCCIIMIIIIDDNDCCVNNWNL